MAKFLPLCIMLFAASMSVSAQTALQSGWGLTSAISQIEYVSRDSDVGTPCGNRAVGDPSFQNSQQP